jgi:hypothetical protein
MWLKSILAICLLPSLTLATPLPLASELRSPDEDREFYWRMKLDKDFRLQSGYSIYSDYAINNGISNERITMFRPWKIKTSSIEELYQRVQEKSNALLRKDRR